MHERRYEMNDCIMHRHHFFLVSNDRVIRKNDTIHGKKLQKLILNIHGTSIIDYVSPDPDRLYNVKGKLREGDSHS